MPNRAQAAACPDFSRTGSPPRKHLAQNDAYPFFEALGDLVVTGPTRTNVMDLHVVLVGAESKRAGTRRRKR